MWVVDGHRGSYFYFAVYRLGFRMASDRFTSSTAQGGGGSFKNRKRIGEIDCCE